MKKIIVVLMIALAIFGAAAFGEAMTSTSPNKTAPEMEAPGIVSLADMPGDYVYYAKKGQTVNDAANILIIMLLEDASTDNKDRSFTLTSYKDISFTIQEKAEGGTVGVNTGDSDEIWELDGSVLVRYKGLISPAGPDSALPKDAFVSLRLGPRYIVRKGNAYYCCSSTGQG